ncbi:MAG: hypothetical protein ACI934_002184, partial [Pseudohongiellaceae bacterium]
GKGRAQKLNLRSTARNGFSFFIKQTTLTAWQTLKKHIPAIKPWQWR